MAVKRKPFLTVSLEIWWRSVFASEVGGESREQLSEAGRPYADEAAGIAGIRVEASAPVFQVPPWPEAGGSGPTCRILKGRALGAT